MLIGQVTDIHLGFEPNNPAEFNRARLDRVVGRFLHGVNRPELVLATGDLVDRGDIASYRRLREAFEELPCPVLCAVGNHDARANFLEVFPETPTADGFIQYVVELDGRRLIIVDTLEEGRHGGAFCEVRAAWLNARLQEAPDTPTVIVMHHPPVEVGIDWMNTHPDEPWVERFARAIAGHRQVQALLCGHIHRAISAPWNGVTVSVCSSSAPQVGLDLRPIDPEAPDLRDMIVAEGPGYALHRWTESGFVSHFGSIGEQVTFARYDAKMQPLVRSMIAERPSGD
ncbi:MAG TPA: phosphodiesterase [Sphingobium sp.]|uniref:phosphodiesterase n=1 Tax=Sphingobium sp. TaxID=1912891 RepID=UPI002ED17F58